jgi:sulfite reductase beta subunit-like hemoprotein
MGIALAGPDSAPAATALAPGAHRLADGRFAATALVPLGRLDRDAVAALAALAKPVRLSRWRTLTVRDVDEAAVAAVTEVLRALGLAVAPGSGWERLSACPGVGACAKARIDVRGAARRRARTRGAGAAVEHWSACERRCGEPRDAWVTVAGSAAGLVVRAAGRERTVETLRAALSEVDA